MKITEKALRANGWKSVFLYTFCSSYFKAVNSRTDLEIVFYVTDDPTIRLRMGVSRVELPNVTSMEALSQLEYLLSERATQKGV